MLHPLRNRSFCIPLIATAIMSCTLSLAPAQPRAAAPDAPANLLTKHERQTFENQTVYISGQAFIRCKFVACTLVLRESAYHLEGCNFERCNWHIDCLLGWGNRDMLIELKALVKLLEEAQQQQKP